MSKEVTTQELALEIRDAALEMNALTYGDFTLSSGQKSGFYFDGRLLTLSPRGANLIGRALLPLIRMAGADAVGGPTLAADPMVASIVLLSGLDEGKPLPGFIVRKETKEHGTGKQIEGPLPQGAKVAIIDDTCSTAGSLFHAIRAAEEAGCHVVLVATVLDRNMGGGTRLHDAGYTYRTLLEADASGEITPAKHQDS